MGENVTINAYERKLFELLLRHELPAECDVRVQVKTKSSKTGGTAAFSLRGDEIAVKSDLKNLKLRRFVGVPPCW
jgi:hypothetical protein